MGILLCRQFSLLSLFIQSRLEQYRFVFSQITSALAIGSFSSVFTAGVEARASCVVDKQSVNLQLALVLL